MSGIFSLKPIVELSPWDKAVMIMLPDKGKKTNKKFLFDDNACKALNLSPDVELGFILDKEYMYLVDITNVNKENFHIKKDEINRISKSSTKHEFYSKTYKFKFFSNSTLYNVLVDEFEMDRDATNIFELRILNADSEIIHHKIKELLQNMGVQNIFIVDFIDSIKKYTIGKRRPSISFTSLENELEEYATNIYFNTPIKKETL